MRRVAAQLQRFSYLVPPLLSLLFLSGSIWVIYQEFRHYSFQAILHRLSTISDRSLLSAIGLTILNYVIVTGYDRLAIRYVQRSLAWYKPAFIATISTAIGNTIGLSLLSSSAIRYRYYSAWGLSAIEIGRVIAFCNLSFWLGLFAVAGVVFIVEPIAIPALLHLPFRSVHPLGFLFLSIIIAYLLWNTLSQRAFRLGNWIFPHLPMNLAFKQILIAALDWIIAAAILYVLLPSPISVSYYSFFGIYLLAQIAGVVSHVPGGLGVFETVMLLLLAPPISSADLLGALLTYRMLYYFLPLIGAVLLLGFYELRQRKP
jgi:uncharacterized membrane protein YbhN (UPF0104 family)